MFHVSRFIFQKRGGFTLIETLLYVAIFSFIIGFTVFVFYELVESQKQTKARIEVEAEANFLMQKIEWALADAQTINQPLAGATSSALSVNKYNFPQNPVVFDFASGMVRLGRGGLEPVPLLTGSVTAPKLVFWQIAASGTKPAAVTVTFSILSLLAETPVRASTTLQNTIYLRQ